MSAARGEFSSRLGFILAASGSAVGLGNIWGFPTQAASNGGGAFLLVYLLLTFLLAYPVFMAELVIGRHAKANVVTALRKISHSPFTAKLGGMTGYGGIITACLILSFYSIVAGWMLANFLAATSMTFGQPDAVAWLTTSSFVRNTVFAGIFSSLTVLIICGGVEKGIERWSTRLMPALLIILIGLTAYVLTQSGAREGLQVYLVPDFSAILDRGLVLDAMGQSFFSLSIGVGTMMIYGSYINKRANLPQLGLSVVLVDVGIAVLAGLLILPAIYVAKANGVVVFDDNGGLIAGPAMIFSVLPALFDSMGAAGNIVGMAFFALMTIAALTSSISMLEVPVAYTTEYHRVSRLRATVGIAAVVFLISIVIILNISWLLDAVVALATKYSQPLIAFLFCIFVGWVWHRDKILKEIRSGFDDVENSLFWRWWPAYVRYLCPLGIFAVFWQSLQ